MQNLLLTAVAASFVLIAQPGSPPAREASIPFVNDGGIRDWQADGDDALYIQDRSGAWYRAILLGPCRDLRFSTAVGFETRSVDVFDRFSSVVVDGRRCTLRSLVKSAPPPVKHKRRKS